MQSIIVLSADREAGYSTHDFHILDHATANLKGQWEVSQVIMPYSWYPVSHFNNVVYWRENNVNVSCVVPPGFYTSNTLSTAVAAAMTTASGGYNVFTMAVGSSSQLTTLSAGNNFELKFATNTTNSIAAVLGFEDNDTVAATSAVSTGIFNLAARTLAVHIVWDQFRAASTMRGNRFTVRVPVTCNPGEVMVYAPTANAIQFMDFGQTIKSGFNISVRDDAGRPIELNGVQWSMTMRPVMNLAKQRIICAQ